MSKKPKEIGERVAVLETRTDGIDVRLGIITETEKACKELQAAAIEAINVRLNSFVNHEITKLRGEIQSAKDSRRDPLRWREKAAIIVAVIASVTAILGQLIARFFG